VDTGYGGIFSRDTLGLVISGNTLIECSPNGINPESDNTHICITGNTIIDPWTSNVSHLATGIRFRLSPNTGFVAGNLIGRGSKTATVVFTHGIRLYSGNTIQLGENRSEGTAYFEEYGIPKNPAVGPD